MESTALSFDLLNSIELRNTMLYGPQKPIDDYRLLAGLLFQRWNDQTHRSVQYEITSISTICIRSTEPREKPFYRKLKVQSYCVAQLCKEECLEGNLINRGWLQLSAIGAQRVVDEWFASSAGILDHLAAGRTLSVETGEMR